MTPEEQRDRLVQGIREALDLWNQSGLWKGSNPQFMDISRVLDEALIQTGIDPQLTPSDLDRTWNEAVDACRVHLLLTQHREASWKLRELERPPKPDHGHGEDS